MGRLYYGDNLDILRRYLKDEPVALVALAPPFNSAQNYNAFFHEKDGTDAASQIHAFEDTWHWDIGTKQACDAVTEQPGKVSDVMQAFYTFLGGNDMMTYLTMKSSRLVELRRVLKPTGSLYLHCDPTASHYLKLLLDAIFGAEMFRREIIGKRTSSQGNVSRGCGDGDDSSFFYATPGKFRWNQPFAPYAEKHGREKFPGVEPDGRRFPTSDMRNPGIRPNLRYDYKGYKPHPNGWAVSKEKMEQWDKEGRLDFNSQAPERLGYPTTKPVALLERIIQASSNPGDLVLDLFCGCGTTIDAAEKLGRDWIGIDVTQPAISLIKNRLQDTYGRRLRFVSGSAARERGVHAASTPEREATSKRAEALAPENVSLLRIIGEPTTPIEAATLAEEDKYQFQSWALGLVGARPVEQKKGADHGLDGKILFRDDPKAAQPEQIVIQVKGGKTGVKDVRDLQGVLDREKAAIGILISLQPATGPRETEAASAGFYEHKTNKQKFPRLQLRTVKELMEGKGIECPTSAASLDDTFKKAPESKQKHGPQAKLQAVATAHPDATKSDPIKP